MAQTYRAAVLNSLGTPLELTDRPIPAAVQGSVVVKVLAANILPYLKAVFEGKIPHYTLSLPLVPGTSAIARVHAAGKDASSTALLKDGQLVLCDMTIRARDEPSNVVLQGVHGGAYMDLMSQWTHGSYAEYAVFPMENVFPLDEARLCGELGYAIEDLCMIPICNVPYGGLSTADVMPGETLLIAPATGRFGGAAVLTALAMGARVVAAGRTQTKLNKLTVDFEYFGDRLRTVVLAGDVEDDRKAITDIVGPAGVDCYVDFSPPEATASNHITTCLGLVRPHGRAIFCGGSLGSVSIPYLELMLKSLRLLGRFMYDREHTVRLIKMAEMGVLPLGDKINNSIVGKFDLNRVHEALEMAEKEPGWGRQVILTP